MKFAIIGGTHGNEWVGVEVMRLFKDAHPNDCVHSYLTFLGNPRAYELKQRYVDSDLNRCFGNYGVSEGYEKDRSAKLKIEIIGQFDFLIDLHTTTSNMGVTLILNNNDLISLKAAAYLQNHFPEIKIIASEVFNQDAPYTNAMVKSGLTIEVGAVPHNVIKSELVFKVYKMVKTLLAWDFSSEVDLKQRTYYQTKGHLNWPKEKGFYIHPHLEDNAFSAINPGDPVFINIKEEILTYQGSDIVYPFFINEAAYQEKDIAMSLSTKCQDLTKMMK